MSQLTKYLKRQDPVTATIWVLAIIYLIISMGVFTAELIIRLSNPEAAFFQYAFIQWIDKWHFVIIVAWIIYMSFTMFLSNFLFIKRMKKFMAMKEAIDKNHLQQLEKYFKEKSEQ